MVISDIINFLEYFILYINVSFLYFYNFLSIIIILYNNNKTNIQRKNIVFPDIDDFYVAWIKSLEEFNLSDKIKTWKQFYSKIKKSKQMYRLSLDNFDLKFSIFLTPNLYCNRYIFG